MKTLSEAMSTQPTPREDIDVITTELVSNMRKIGIDPTPYAIAIRLTAETIRERERAYSEYMANGGKQTTEKGRSDATALRLCAWNGQVRACLSMLKLTPVRVSKSDADPDSEEG